jgi:hypothetical protein
MQNRTAGQEIVDKRPFVPLNFEGEQEFGARREASSRLASRLLTEPPADGKSQLAGPRRHLKACQQTDITRCAADAFVRSAARSA